MSKAGSRIVPVVIGNATGTILGGTLITRTKRYIYLTVFGICCSITCFTLMCLRWHGNTAWTESLYVYLAGFGMGSTQSTTFVHIAASLDHSEIAIAGTTWFLAQSFGSLIGASFATSLMHKVLQLTLRDKLDGFPNKAVVRFSPAPPPPPMAFRSSKSQYSNCYPNDRLYDEPAPVSRPSANSLKTFKRLSPTLTSTA